MVGHREQDAGSVGTFHREGDALRRPGVEPDLDVVADRATGPDAGGPRSALRVLDLGLGLAVLPPPGGHRQRVDVGRDREARARIVTAS
ncbi:hypothetical protein [Sphaerimonospora thailandensis]|uniref:hypothetical protein n=1 Tax=Sphaerimonospora thailandensis TaxID=795644 RepID=UPI0019514F6E|nr:hypothetical protein [Sphaerimonospora thailandensis]